MKTRYTFVSNSSSSSFVIDSRQLTKTQTNVLLEYLTEENEDHFLWSMERDLITGYTSMDNGHLKEFMDNHDLTHSVVMWEGD